MFNPENDKPTPTPFEPGEDMSPSPYPQPVSPLNPFQRASLPTPPAGYDQVSQWSGRYAVPVRRVPPLTPLYAQPTNQVNTSSAVVKQIVAGASIATVDKNTPNAPSSISVSGQQIVKSADGTLTENVTLNWAAPTTPPAVTGYLIRYKISTATVYTYNRVNNVTTATLHGLLLNATYNISVAAVGEVNQPSAFPPDIALTTNNNTTAPSTVTGLAAVGAFRQVALTWNAVSDSDLAYYQIEWAPNSGGSPGTFQVISHANTNAYNDRGDSARGQLAVSTTYWYRVSAFNTTGVQGGLSSNLSATTTTVGMDSDISDGSTYGRPLISRLNAGRPLIDFSEAIHLNKILDNIGDGSTYARVIASDMTTNRIDFSKSLLNKHLGNVPDDSTSGRYAGLQAGSNGDGFQILSNPDFTGGSLSGYTVYDNAASGKVTHTAVQDATTPNSSGWNLQITTASGTPSPSPGLGGFYRKRKSKHTCTRGMISVGVEG